MFLIHYVILNFNYGKKICNTYKKVVSLITISLRSRSRNEIFISIFKGFVLLLPTQTFFYFMAIETRYVCEEDNETYLYTFQDENIISICISQNQVINSIHLTKSDIIELITELNSSLNNLI